MQLLTTTLLFTIIHDDSTSENRDNGSFSIITFLVWLSTEAVAFFTPRPSLFSLLALQYCLIYWETLCTALQTEKLWIWSTGLSTLLTPSFQLENWVSGNLFVLMGEVANRMSCGSFRGGHWRYLPIRNHDNRSSADWIRLCPGLSKNSENGNSCPKPHKAARHDWSSGKSGQHWDWDY